MRRLDTAVAAAMFTLFTGMVIAAARYPQEARLVPMVVGIPAMLLAGWQLSRELTKDRSAVGAPAGRRAGQTHRSRESMAVGWLALFALTVLAGGFIVGGSLGVMMCQRFWLRESWRTTIAGGVVAFAIVYVCFERALGLVLFGGWLSEWARG